ncbi:MAG: GtrA family protein [Duncaniella sp.]|nr:GtrA family protein [Duncaniella sp.]MDE5734479.1 GtrA family protein [Duncaniella sp.]MDE6179194.1 GtrA family protein [Duncaniella sp.]MDE6391183.1 GtrA family protein [Duncaniella sp.]
MKRKIRRLTGRLVNGADFVPTLLRSTVASQISSWTDMGVSFISFAFLHLAPWLSTAIGAFIGGVVNCIINYRFTFHAQGLSVKAVVVKFSLVWLGSLLLNVFGTQWAYMGLQHLQFLITDLGFKPNGFYAAARLGVSLIVCVLWNFLLQKTFVYRRTDFDPYAVRLVNTLLYRG